MKTEYLERLDRFIDLVLNTEYDALPRQTADRAKRVVFDSIGVMLSGSLEPENIAAAARLPRGGPDGATLFAAGLPRTESLRAAFFNATQMVFLEMDEHHRPTGHPGCHVVPASLVEAEHSNCSGKDYLNALVLGYDLAARMSAGCVLRDFMHCYGHYGALGGATAIAKLRRYDKDHIREAIHISAGMPLFSSWDPCFEGATVRNTYPGMAAVNAVLSADLASFGYTGLSRAIPHTFGELIGSSFDITTLDSDLGAPFLMDSGLFKFHGCCAMNHPPIDAFYDAVREEWPDWHEIDHMVVRVTDRCLRLYRLPAPRQLSTKFSIPFAIATTAWHRHSGIEAFRDKAAADPEILDLASRVYMVSDQELTARWPEDGGASIQIFLKDGRVLQGAVDNPYGWPKTHPSNDENLIRKFADLNHKLVSEPQARAIFALCNKLASYEHMQDFISDLHNIMEA